MATTSLPTEVAAPPPPKRRWRFSIRQLLLSIVAIAVALVLYREVPDMVRRQVYNDPLPLVVGDKRQIHVRQMPYLPMRHFACRVYLPTDKEYEICIGFPGEGETFPTPTSSQVIGTQPGRDEGKIVGFTAPGSTQDNTKFIVQVDTCSGPASVSSPPLEVEIASHAGNETTYRTVGIRATDSFSGNERVILYRRFWQAQNADSQPYRTIHSPGTGFIVWIQPKSLEKK